MAEPCLCGQATAEPTCTVTAGAGIDVNDTQISAHSANAWTPYTPTLENLTLGNGVNASRFLLVGKTVDVLIALRFGTTSTFTATAWRFGMPPGATPFFGSTPISASHVFGLASMKDNSAADPWFSGEAILDASANPIQIRYGDDAGGTNVLVAQGTPYTWTNLDELVIRFRCEVV